MSGAAGPDFDPGAAGRWLAGHLPGLDPAIVARRLAGGQSNPTYVLETSAGIFVLRRKPFGPLLPSAHAIEREYRLLVALHPQGFPVPRPIGLCEDASVIGAPFYVMAHVEGRVLHDATLPGHTARERRAIHLGLVETLARLQAIEPASVGLGDFGRPGAYVARQIERWTRQVAAAPTGHTPALAALGQRLGRDVPEQSATTIVHGDWRLDNLILAPDGAAPRAVIDWELATLGDPLADATYLFMNWTMPRDGRSGLGGVDVVGLGIPGRAEAVALYERLTGRAVTPVLDWYVAYNLFRLGAIYQGIEARLLAGTAASADGARLVTLIPGLIAAAEESLARAG